MTGGRDEGLPGLGGGKGVKYDQVVQAAEGWV